MRVLLEVVAGVLETQDVGLREVAEPVALEQLRREGRILHAPRERHWLRGELGEPGLDPAEEFADRAFGAGGDLAREDLDRGARGPAGVGGEVGGAHQGGEALAVHDAVAQEEAAHERVHPLDQELAEARRTEHAQGQRDVHLLGGAVRDGVEDVEAAHTVGVARRPREPDRTAPVLRHHRRLVEVERFEQRLEPIGVPRDAIQLGAIRLVRAAEAEVVGDDGAVACGDQRRDEVAIEVAPGRVAVHQDDRAPAAGSLVDVVHASVAAVEPVRGEGPGAAEGPIDLLTHVRLRWTWLRVVGLRMVADLPAVASPSDQAHRDSMQRSVPRSPWEPRFAESDPRWG